MCWCHNFTSEGGRKVINRLLTVTQGSGETTFIHIYCSVCCGLDPVLAVGETRYKQTQDLPSGGLECRRIKTFYKQLRRCLHFANTDASGEGIIWCHLPNAHRFAESASLHDGEVITWALTLMSLVRLTPTNVCYF